MPSPSKDITAILGEWGRGDASALDALVPLVYGDLRRLAAYYLRRERPDHTLQPTALVHEVYLRLAGQAPVNWEGRTQFFAIAARLIRQVLVQHARRHRAAKRGGAGRGLSVTGVDGLSERRPVELLALDDALRALSSVDPQKGRIVELRFFAGLTVEEVAGLLGVAPITVKREWRLTKAWLRRELTKG